MTPDYLTAPLLAETPGVRHAFFTRRGPGSGMDCALGQTANDAERARRNRLLASRTLAGPAAGQPVIARQVHGRDVVTVDGPWPGQPPEADGLVTRRPGVILAVLTADCAPALLADATAGVVAAAHAGWRGALDGVLEATVDAMAALGAHPARIRAAIGPCIGPSSYQVGPDFPAPFLARDAGDARFFRQAADPDRLLFDLPGYAARRLAACGVNAVAVLDADTFADPRRFYSYRHGTQNDGDKGGRQLSAIMLAAA